MSESNLKTVRFSHASCQDRITCSISFSGNISEYASTFLKNIGTGVGGFVSVVTTTVVTIVIIPIMLIYMLLDGDKLKGNLVKLMPYEYHKETKKILGDVHLTIMSYIRGQVIVSIGVGIIAYIGYLIIELIMRCCSPCSQR